MPNQLTTTRGIRANNDVFQNIPCAVFSASKWVGPRQSQCAGHAMLTHMTPGEVWPTNEGGTTIPVELSNVYVHPEWRRRGLGTAMVRKCLDYCSRRNFECVLRVTPYGAGHTDAATLVKWYERLGFRVYWRDDVNIYMFKGPKHANKVQ